MKRERMTGGGWVVGAMLLAVVVGSALTVASCGSGGGNGIGGIDGGLCAQCGDTDGPCQSSVQAPADDLDFFCPGATDPTTCNVSLTCLRKLGGAERVCYPSDFEQFRCDGERAQRPTPTPIPTPTLTGTATVSPTSTDATATPTGPTATAATPSASGATQAPTPTVTATTGAIGCGDGIVEGAEDCDGANLDDETCTSLCIEPGGTLRCNPDCTFDVSGCNDPDCA